MDLLTVDQVAQLLKVSRITVYRLIKQEKLQSIKFGKKQIRINREEILTFLSKHINDYYKLLDQFKNPQIGNLPENSTRGYLSGFMATTGYFPTKNVRIVKDNIFQIWEKLKEDEKYWKINDNHQLDLPPVGYLQVAKLYEKDEWAGIYGVVVVTNKDAWERAQKGLLGGFSLSFIAFNQQLDTSTMATKAAVIDLEANSYTDGEIGTIKDAFSNQYELHFNQIYKFSELPPLIITIKQIFDFNLYMPVLINVAKVYLITDITTHAIKKVMDLMIEDFYSVIKKVPKLFFDRKDQRKPTFILKSNLFAKEIKIRIQSKDLQDFIQDIDKLKKYLPKMLENNKDYIKNTKVIFVVKRNNIWTIQMEQK